MAPSSDWVEVGITTSHHATTLLHGMCAGSRSLRSPAVEVIPGIDLSGGRVVRLLKGDFDAVTEFPEDPEELAGRYAAGGAEWLHVIDLDAARSGERDPGTAALLARLAARKRGRLQVGGGFRRPEQVD